MIYRDRYHAGQVLAERLREFSDSRDALVLALPRGGVPVGSEVARALQLPFDVFVVRKLGVPGHQDLAMGAVASGGVRFVDPEVIARLGIGQDTIAQAHAHESAELQRLEHGYRGDAPGTPVAGKALLLIDDGMASEADMRLAVEALRLRQPERVVVALPVSSPATCEALRGHADDVVCAASPDPFSGIGDWYADFGQTTEREVQDLLRLQRGG